MNTKQNNKVKEGKLHHSSELCVYVLNTSALMLYSTHVFLKVHGFLAYFFNFSGNVTGMTYISNAAEITTTVVT